METTRTDPTTDDIFHSTYGGMTAAALEMGLYRLMDHFCLEYNGGMWQNVEVTDTESGETAVWREWDTDITKVTLSNDMNQAVVQLSPSDASLAIFILLLAWTAESKPSLIDFHGRVYSAMFDWADDVGNILRFLD